MNASCALHPGVPAAGTCPRCGNFYCAQCGLDPVTGVCPTCTQRSGEVLPLPWEEREKLGTVKALLEQVKLGVLKPGSYVARIRPDRPWQEAFFFGWFISTLTALLSVPYTAFNFWSSSQQLKDAFGKVGGSAGDTLGPVVKLYEWLGTHPLGAAMAVSIYAIVMFPPMFFLNAGAQHVGLGFLGVERQPFAATLRANAYAHVVNLLTAIPVVGGFAGFYALVLQVWALRDVHKTTTGKAIVAALWLSLTLGCCVGVGAVAFVVAAVSRIK